MERWASILFGLLVIAGVGAVIVRWMVRSLKNSEDPPKLIFKWIIAVVMLVGLAFFAFSVAGSRGSVVVPFACVFFGVVMSVLWAPSIGTALIKPLTSLFDGGDLLPEPRPFYSIAIANRGKGKYLEAITEIRKQLDKFPADVEGQMLLAEIQVENLKDLATAENTIRHLCEQSEQAPQNIAYGLTTLADWHLKYSQDPEAARQDLQTIIERFPDTGIATRAAQRIAHLPSTEQLLAAHDRPPVVVPSGVDNLGLLRSIKELRPAETGTEELAAEYVSHLEKHPLDIEAREKLAVLYAEHYQRLDLAVDQLEQLIQQPHQPAKQIVHWLNLLADLQIKQATNVTEAHQTLQRIIAQYPDSAAAHNAQRRLDILKRELKGRETSQPIKLGTYEQNLGLKRKA